MQNRRSRGAGKLRGSWEASKNLNWRKKKRDERGMGGRGPGGGEGEGRNCVTQLIKATRKNGRVGRINHLRIGTPRQFHALFAVVRWGVGELVTRTALFCSWNQQTYRATPRITYATYFSYICVGGGKRERYRPRR